MKQLMGIKKVNVPLPQSIEGIEDYNFNWDSFETMAGFYIEQIKKTEVLLNRLSIMDDTKLVIKLCGKIIAMKKKLKGRNIN